MAFEPKKLALLRILTILERHSSEKNPLTQSDILRRLEKDYGIVLERKAVGSNISLLREAGIDIAEIPHKGVYLASRTFCDEDLRVLIDCIMFSKNIGNDSANQLIKKLEGLMVDDTKSYSTIHRTGGFMHASGDTVNVINELSVAIANGVKVRFMYNDYGRDKRLYPVWNEACIINPYCVITMGDHYYLLGNDDRYDNVENFRLDKITGLMTLDEPRKDVRQTSQKKLEPGRYMSAYPYMSGSATTNVRAFVKDGGITCAIDAFGTQFEVIDSDADGVIIMFTSGEDDAYLWALKNGDYVQILSPQTLRNRVRQTVAVLRNAYLKNDDDKYFSAIESCQRDPLKHLELSNVKVRDRLKFADLSDVRYLYLSDTDVNDLSFVGHMGKLSVLRLKGKSISDISQVSKCSNLKALGIVMTDVRDISCLKGKELEELDLYDNPIDDYTPLYEMKNLKYLVIGSSAAQKVDEVRMRELYPDIAIEVRQEGARTYAVKKDYIANTDRKKPLNDDLNLKPSAEQIKLANVYPYNLLRKVCRNCTFIDDKQKIEQRIKAVIRKTIGKEGVEVLQRIYEKGQSPEKIASEWKCDVRFVTEYMDSAIFKLSFAFKNGEFDDIVKR